MKRNRCWATFVVAIIVSLQASSLVLGASPLQWRGSKGWEPEGAYCRLYDAKSVVTLSGVIGKVEAVRPLKGMGAGVHLLLVTEKETIPVQLGPTWYVEKQMIQFKAQDHVEVTGSRVLCDETPVILAAIVRRGTESVSFREVGGKPSWSVWQAK